jgi:methylmalonyl-CoA/ethylmalonyl-CoA epimerase
VASSDADPFAFPDREWLTIREIAMTRALPNMHHVVFCVLTENLDRTRLFWEDLGFEFAQYNLDDAGLAVLLDWDRGVEIISLLDAPGTETSEIERFLSERREGVYSVVIRTADVDQAISVASGHGAQVDFQQDRSSDGLQLREARLAPYVGMPVTLLTTDLP